MKSGMNGADDLEALNTPEPKDRLMERLLREATALPPDDLPSIPAALEFRREAYGLTAKEFAKVLGLSKSQYSMLLHGKRKLTRKAAQRAYAVGVPATVLLQREAE